MVCSVQRLRAELVDHALELANLRRADGRYADPLIVKSAAKGVRRRPWRDGPGNTTHSGKRRPFRNGARRSLRLHGPRRASPVRYVTCAAERIASLRSDDCSEACASASLTRACAQIARAVGALCLPE